MAKGIPFTIADLEAKGFRDDGTGVFHWVRPDQRMDAPKKAVVHKEIPIGLIAIENVLKVANVEYEKEYKFSEKRKFRFDIALIKHKVGIEYEGIFSVKSRHTNVNGYTTDADKYNLAQAEGWKVLRYTAKNYKKFIEDIKQII